MTIQDQALARLGALADELDRVRLEDVARVFREELAGKPEVRAFRSWRWRGLELSRVELTWRVLWVLSWTWRRVRRRLELELPSAAAKGQANRPLDGPRR